MNRIETKIIIMVTNKLAAAKDREAKTELIEELSENLYQRYQDLIADGIVEEDALAITMDSIGDVKELLAYLKEESAEDNKGENIHESEKYDTIARKIEKEIEPLAREIEKKVRKEIVPFTREFSKLMEQEMMPQMRAMKEQMEKEIAPYFQRLEKEMETDMEQEMSESKVTALSAINVDDIHTVKLEISNGEVEVSVNDNLNLIDICSESDDLEIFEPEPGVLEIKQKRVKRKNLLSRMIEKKIDVSMELPSKIWECVELRTAGGWISVCPDLVCKNLIIATAGGNIEVEKAAVQNARLHTVSGCISAKINSPMLYASSVSGEVEIFDSVCETGEFSSVSGSLTLNLACREKITTKTTSGDTELLLTELPKCVKMSSVSGNCTLNVPDEKGFSLQYKTTSGQFEAESLAFNGIMKGKSGNLSYLGGGDCEISMSSVSGNITIYTEREN